MSDRLATVLVAIITPYEKAWGWWIRRQYRRGKFRRPYGDPRDIGCPCVRAKRVVMDEREPGEAFCSNCPDHEGCMTGYPCSVVKATHRDAA